MVACKSRFNTSKGQIIWRSKSSKLDSNAFRLGFVSPLEGQALQLFYMALFLSCVLTEQSEHTLTKVVNGLQLLYVNQSIANDICKILCSNPISS